VIRPELMDQPDLDVRRHVEALDALGRANAVSLTASAIWPAIRAAARSSPRRPTHVLDVACGGGHVLCRLARKARHEGIAVDWLGWDRSPVAIEYARTLARRTNVQGARFEQADVMHDPMPAGVDVVICTLFLHHLREREALALLQSMQAAARRLVVVSDLRRGPLGRAFTWVACHTLSTSTVFRTDGMRSIAAAFTTAEARALADRAGLAGAQVRQVWPQRWLLIWDRVREPEV
jgi:2-polyprenyl-3-methyl-5-hydroxy-6-metoxy-1,4-benzoquinol methylase